MRNISIILFVALLLSCGEKKQQRELEWSSVELEETRNTDMSQDSVQTTISAPKEDAKLIKEPVSSSGSVKSSSKKYNADNLRGWDPASEDDMDDNGMSRYMDNNDDEGWD